MTDVLLTVTEAAGYLRCHPQTVRGYIHAKRLPAVQVGRQYRIKLSDLQAGVLPVDADWRLPADGKFRNMARSM